MSRLAGPLARLLVLVSVVLLLAPACRDTRGLATPGPSFSVLQMNLCLSGRAACAPRVQYPLGVREAAEVIRTSRVDTVTLNEVCQGDVAKIAVETGYQARFAAVPSYVLGDDCINPGERGVFGVAVLTKARITASVDRAYTAQDTSMEQRHWLCVTTDEARVCTTHLEIRGSYRLDQVNDAQCAEFAGMLARLEGDRPLLAGGDLNRDEPCAPAGMWVRTDVDAVQAPGKQHAYGTSQLVEPQARIVPMRYSDHDAVLVSSRLAP